MPAGLFYEWQKVGTAKQPHAIARADQATCPRPHLGGLAISTRRGGSHLRLLEKPDWRVWLGEEAGDAAALLRPGPSGTSKAWPVSPRANSLRNNNAGLIKPVAMAGEV